MEGERLLKKGLSKTIELFAPKLSKEKRDGCVEIILPLARFFLLKIGLGFLIFAIAFNIIATMLFAPDIPIFLILLWQVPLIVSTILGFILSKIAPPMIKEAWEQIKEFLNGVE